MAYTFDNLFAADPSNPTNVAANASILLYDPADPTKAPVTITDPTGSPIPNPVTVNKNGFGPAMQHATLDRLAWEGGGFSNFITSYEGMKNEAVSARTAAEEAAATAGADAAAVADAAIGTATDEATAAAAAAEAAADAADASALAAANSAALVGAPADNAIATAINATGSATKTALSATIATATTGKADTVSVAAAESVNADHAAAFGRVQRAFLAPPAGLFLARSGNDYTFLVGLGSGRYGAFLLPRYAQSLNGVTYTINCLGGCAVQMPMLSEDDTNATYSGTWSNQFTPTITSPGYKAKPLNVNTTSGSQTITVTSGTLHAGDVGRRIYIPGAGASGAVLESTINTVNVGAGTFTIGTAPSATLTGVSATIYPSYRYNATTGATVAWTSPANTTALAVGVLLAANGGLTKVTINSDATLANLLPTAQQVVDSGRYANTILVANGGTLNPTDRVIDHYATTTTYDQKRMIAEGLTAGAHTVVLTVAGYQAVGGTGTRTYIDRFASATAATTPVTAGAEMFTAYDFTPGFGSAWEYAIDTKPVGGSTFTFVGQVAHQLEEQTGFSVYINDLGATPADGTITSCNSASIVRTTNMFHSETGATLASPPWATTTTTYRLDRRGLTVTPEITFNRDMVVRTAYSMMPLAPRTGVMAKADKAALEASATTLTMTGSSTRQGMSRSASAWAWDSTGKVGAAMYVPDHYGFTDGYTVPGLSQVEDRGGSVPTTKFYFPWAGPDVERTFPAGFKKRWTTRHMIGYFADANATLSVL